VANVPGTAPGVTTNIVGRNAAAVNVGSGGSAQGIQGPLNLEGPTAPGGNIIKIDDSTAAGSRTATLSSFQPNGSDSEGNNDPYGKVNGLAPADINYEYADTSSITIKTGSSSTPTSINVLQTGVVTNLVTKGTTTINVGSSGSAQGILGTLNVDGTAGGNTITVDSSADTVSAADLTGTSSTGTVHNLAPADVTYTYLSTAGITVKGGTLSTLNVQATGVTTNFVGGSATAVNVGSGGSAQGIQGPLNLENATTAANTIVLDDGGDATARVVTLSAFAPNPADAQGNTDPWGKVSGLAADVNYEYADTASLTILGGTGGGSLAAQATGVTTTFVGGGATTVAVGQAGSVQNIQGALNLENPAAKNTVTLDDSADATARVVTLSSLTNPGDSQGNGDLYGKVGGLAPADVNYEAGDTASVSVTGGSGGNTFRVGVAVAGGGTLTLDGGSGTNTLVGPNLANTWTVSAANQGGIAGVVTSFSRFQSLTGGPGTDAFAFANGATIAGKLDGGPGTAADTVDLSAYATPRSVTLTGPGTSDGFAGSEASIAGGFDDIDGVVGGQASDTLTGLNAAATWTVNNPGASLYRSGGRSLSFSSFETLDGGAAADVINVTATGGTPLAVNGMGGGDSITVEFGPLTAAVNVTETGGGTNTLTVSGAAASKTYTVTAAQVADNSATPQQLTYAGVQGLTVNGGDAGNDFNVQSTAAGTPVTVHTGNGSNGVQVGSANNSSGVVDNLAAALTVNAGSGLTGLVINDQGSTVNDSVTVTAAAVTLSKTVGASPRTVTVNYSASGNLELLVATGGGNDSVLVQGTAANVMTFISTAAGTDGVTVGSTSDSSGVVDNLLGPLSVDLGGGTNGLVVNDLGGTTTDGVVLFGTSITVGKLSRQLHVSYAASGGTLALNVQTGSGDDQVNVQGTAANATTIIGAGAGTDSFGVAVTAASGYAQSGPGSLFLDGGAGADALVVADLTGGGIRRPNPATLPSGTQEVDYSGGLSSFISYAGMESVT
jgi:hypothetical protein